MGAVMNNRIFCSISLAFLLITAVPSWGEQIKAYVSPCSVTGGANKDEMKAALQTLLMSRLTVEKILAVDSSAGSDIAIACSYVVFGKIYSIDAVAKNSSGSVIARGFAQGEGQDDLIPAIGKLAKALTDDIVAANVVVTAPKMPPADVDRTKKTSGDIVRKDTIAPPRGDIIRAAEIEKSGGSGWVSQRLGGTMTNIAIGRTLETGEREIFISEDHSLRFYRQGKDLKLIAEVPLGIGKKILAVDTADLDGDGVPEV